MNDTVKFTQGSFVQAIYQLQKLSLILSRVANDPSLGSDSMKYISVESSIVQIAHILSSSDSPNSLKSFVTLLFISFSSMKNPNSKLSNYFISMYLNSTTPTF